MAKAGTKQSRQQSKSLIEGIEPKYPAVGISADQAVKQLEEILRDFFQRVRKGEREDICVGIHATAGLGKSKSSFHFVTEIARADPTFRTEIYCPTIELAEEAEQTIRDEFEFGGVQIIRGRKQESQQQTENTSSGRTPAVMCKRHRLVETLERLRITNIHDVLCDRRVSGGLQDLSNDFRSRCPHFEDCEYLAQVPTEQIVIYTHHHLSLSRASKDTAIPSLAIIDESCLHAIEEYDFWTLGDFLDSEDDVLMDFVGLIRSRDENGLLASIRDKFPAIEQTIEDLLKKFAPDDLRIDPSRKDSTIEHQIDNLEKTGGLAKHFHVFLQILKAALESGSKETHSIWYDKNTQTVQAARFNPPVRLNGVPTLILDATLKEELIRHIFPRIEYHHIRVRRLAKTTQVFSSSVPTSTLKDSKPADWLDESDALEDTGWIEKVYSFARSKAKLHRSGVVIGPKAFISTLTRLTNIQQYADTTHFNALRGKNRWSHRNWCLIVGRNQPAAWDAEKRARAFFGDDICPLKLTGEFAFRPEGYRMRSGELLGVEAHYHVDDRVQCILEMIREDETIQAIDRLRLLHGTEEKRIYILSNLPVDITVDQLYDTNDFLAGGTPLVRAWRRSNGVLPLAVKDLSMVHRELFSSPDSAKYHIDADKNIGGVSYRTSIWNSTQYRYKRAGGRGRWSTVLSSLSATNTKGELERLLGTPVDVLPIEEI